MGGGRERGKKGELARRKVKWDRER